MRLRDVAGEAEGNGENVSDSGIPGEGVTRFSKVTDQKLIDELESGENGKIKLIKMDNAGRGLTDVDNVADSGAVDEEFKSKGVKFDIVPPQILSMLQERRIEVRKRKKKASETASVSPMGEHQPTVVSNADGTKIVKNLL